MAEKTVADMSLVIAIFFVGVSIGAQIMIYSTLRNILSELKRKQ